jgi:hypothetical protein
LVTRDHVQVAVGVEVDLQGAAHYGHVLTCEGSTGGVSPLS